MNENEINWVETGEKKKTRWKQMELSENGRKTKQKRALNHIET